MATDIRLAQLIAPFGPGSIYTDRYGTPHVVCGLDHWFDGVELARRMEFERSEVRLADKLDVDRFYAPPDHRETRQGQAAPPNANLTVPWLRFPRWYRATRSGRMRRLNYETNPTDVPPWDADNGAWRPVRFIAVCGAGHLCDFPWKEWARCECPGGSLNGTLVLDDRGGADLASISIRCATCGKSRNLSGTTVRPEEGQQSKFEQAGIACPGSRPWFGDNPEPGCEKPLVAALINQSNIYFATTDSALYLPDRTPVDDLTRRIRLALEGQSTGNLKMLWRSGEPETAVFLTHKSLSALPEFNGEQLPDDKIKEALGGIFEGAGTLPDQAVEPAEPESEELKFRRSEFDVLRVPVDDPEVTRNLRTVEGKIAGSLKAWFGRMILVERLRETRAFVGFDRLEESPGLPRDPLDQLFLERPREPNRWLPAIQIYGEGLFFELDEERVQSWQKDNSEWLRTRVSEVLRNNLAQVHRALPPLGAPSVEWASRYLLVHTLSHILTNQFVFESGYGTAALRERLFVSADKNAPMAGILIYTAAGDSEGTLGGLVRLG